jgi:hypothetical protein
VQDSNLVSDQLSEWLDTSIHGSSDSLDGEELLGLIRNDFVAIGYFFKFDNDWWSVRIFFEHWRIISNL